MTQKQARSPKRHKMEIERRLEAHADIARHRFDDTARIASAARPAAGGEPVGDALIRTPSQQYTGRGHKAQWAQPHRSGRPSGGNIRTDREE